MELLQLKYFQELAKSEQLTKTAQKLHIAQPSLSQTLKRLENELGIPLFDRVGKKIVLNDTGKIFLRYVDEVFTALDNAKAEIAAASHKESKTVSLHVYAASLQLPELIQRIQEADSEIHLQINQQPVLDRTGTEAMDMAGYMSGTAEKTAELYLEASQFCPQSETTIPLIEERIVAALPKNHPLSGKEILYCKDLEMESFISLSPTSNLAEIIGYYCENIGFKPRITTWADNPSMVRELLKLNLGIALIPELTWKGFADDRMVLRPVADMPMKRYILLSWHSGGTQTASARLCRDIIVTYFKERFYNM